MTKLADLPKDLLVKLILTVENTLRRSLTASYQKIYRRQEGIYKGIARVLPDRIAPAVCKCSFPGCKEFKVWNDKYETEEAELNQCHFCNSGIYYCDAHDKFDYISHESRGYGPACPNCKVKKLGQGWTMACKDTDDYSKEYKMELRKRRQEDKLKMQKEKDKVMNYYSLPKDELIKVVVNIGSETKLKYEKRHMKEMKRADIIMERLHQIVIDKYFPSVITCAFEGCENFKVENENVDPYFYNNIKMNSCDSCGTNYCAKHKSNFHRFKKNNELRFCTECKIQGLHKRML